MIKTFFLCVAGGFIGIAHADTSLQRQILRIPGEGAGFSEQIGYWTVDSGKPGPTLAILAAQHGNELSGSVVVRDFVLRATNEIVRGKIIGIPFANPLAMRRRSPSADLRPGEPYARSTHNMQTLWSTTNGNDTARLAGALWTGLLAQADCVMDVHCYPKCSAAVAAVRDNAANIALGEASGMKFLNRVPCETDWKGHVRTRAVREGKLALGIELSGQYEVFPEEVRRGVRVAVNVAKYLKIFDGEPEGVVGGTVRPVGQETVYAPGCGLFVPAEIKPGDRVSRGQRLGYVLVEPTLEELPVESPCDGWLMRFVGRADCDVDIRDFSSYVFLDDAVAKILPDRK